MPNSFGLDDVTLLDALAFKGGEGALGAAQILLRAAVAALLNASHPDVTYPRLPADVIADVNTALASEDRATMLTLAEALDADNNEGDCPLGSGPASPSLPSWAYWPGDQGDFPYTAGAIMPGLSGLLGLAVVAAGIRARDGHARSQLPAGKRALLDRRRRKSILE